METPNSWMHLRFVCSGAYWLMEYQKAGMPASTSVWNIISVGGVTMREAVDAWWGQSSASGVDPTEPAATHSGANPQPFITDCLWHSHGKGVFCNPVCDGFPYY
jgi:hypothetical protein